MVAAPFSRKDVSRAMDAEPGSLALSELISLTVVDSAGIEVGELIDVVAEFAPEAPPVTAFFIARDDEQLCASWQQVAEIDVDGERLVLGCPADALGAASLRGAEIALRDAVLDKQVVNMRDRSFVRVQDVILDARGGGLVVAGVDASHGALARRFGLGFLARRLPRRSGDYVPWEDVNAISLRLSRLNFVEAFAELAELHPADIADVVGQVGTRERAAVLGALNAYLAADTLQEMDEDLRAAALAEMPVTRAAKVLEKLDADVAADLLADLPEDLADELLSLQPDQRERDLRGLASHAEDSAGGLMTLEYVTLSVGTTAGAALEWLRRERPDQHAMSYVYVLDADGHLAGVLSLRELVLADQANAVDEIMEDDVVTVAADTDEEEVGRVMTKYNLLAVPVVDEERRMLGIVTLDDALDAILPEDWKRRLPRLFR
jgi:magnesium transporter